MRRRGRRTAAAPVVLLETQSVRFARTLTTRSTAGDADRSAAQPSPPCVGSDSSLGNNGGESGHSVSAAGDVNGDGIDDLIVGALFASPGGQSGAGESYVVFGRSTASLSLGDGVTN